MNDTPRSGCFRNGCIGCLVLLALAVGMVFVVGALQMVAPDPEPTPESHRLEKVLPERPPAGAKVDRPPLLEGVELPPGEEISEPAPGSLVLDLSLGNFRIVPGPAGEPIRVNADYDTASFDLREQYDTRPDGSWTWTIEFGSRRSWLGMLLSGGSQGARNDVEIVVPRGTPLAIVGKIGTGESEIDLGGLWIDHVSLELGIGEHFLEIREPLPRPIDHMKIVSSVGDVELRDLGEASPRNLYIEHDVGELYVDLGGPWARDAEIEIDAGIGETRIELPDTARISLPRAGVSLGEARIDRDEIAALDAELPPDAPTLELRVSSGIGEIRIGR